MKKGLKYKWTMYKLTAFLSLMALLCGIAHAQIPPPYSGNYISSTEYLTENTSGNKKTNILYLDKFGNEKQAVNVWGTPAGKDIHVEFRYDDYGRQIKNYLPFPSNNSNGSFENITNDTYSYYETHYNESQYVYSEVLLEAPPLGRILKKAAPGEEWHMGSGHEVNYKYEIAPTSDAVIQFKAITSLSGDIYHAGLQNMGYYSAGELHKTTVMDENGSMSEQFVNRKGQTVLVRRYSTSGTVETLIRHDTYYIFDSYGNLTYMLPPKLSAIGSISQTHLDNLGYQYKYDVRNRLVEKKLPGKGWEYIVYDKLDRAVAVKDAVNQWLFVKYDEFDRIVYTGIYNGSESRASLQSVLNTQTVLNESRTMSGTTVDGIILFYTNNSFPVSNYSLLTVDYYDGYNNILQSGVTLPSVVESQAILNGNNNLNGVPVASFTRILGSNDWEKIYTFYDNRLQPVRTQKINYLGGYTIADSKLDFRGKPEYTKTFHKRTSGVNEISIRDNYVYDHQERLVSISGQIGSGSPERIFQNTFDELGKPVEKSVGNHLSMPALQKVDYSFNIRGWMTGINNVQNLVEQGAPTDLFAFKINYNDPVSIHFDAAGADVVPMYNGNIAETFWRTASDDVLRGYGYEYDDLNRLKEALYQKPNAVIPVPGNFDEGLFYDLNGNITALKRKSSVNDMSAILTDDLSYNYTADTNRLLRVTDATNSATGFDNGTSGTSNDYTYDLNGNMLTDKNKGITSVVYNHMNQPTNVVWASTKKLEFVYNAAGEKIQRKKTDGSVITVTDYLDGFQYNKSLLEFFPHAEGYVKATVVGLNPSNPDYAFNYVYNYTDHLGNIRLSYTKDPQTGKLKILDENHFYPFGLKHNKTSSFTIVSPNFVDVIVAPVVNNPYDYRFQGQELQDDHDLNWYSYRFRNYDPAIGRFFNVDPLTEEYHDWGEYVFSGNRVVDSFELEGLEPVHSGEAYGVKTTDEYGWEWVSTGTEWAIPLEGVTVTGKAQSSPGTESMRLSLGAPFLTNDYTNSYGGFRSYGNDTQQGFLLPGMIVASEVATQTATQATVAETAGSVLPRSMGALSATIMLYGDSNFDTYEVFPSGSVEYYSHQRSVDRIVDYYKDAKDNRERNGSYTIYFDGGFSYHGKGYLYRAFQSALQKYYIHGRFPYMINWDPAPTERQAFKDEYIRMYLKDANFKMRYLHGHENPTNYNIRRSPGYNYLLQDGQLNLLPKK